MLMERKERYGSAALIYRAGITGNPSCRQRSFNRVGYVRVIWEGWMRLGICICRGGFLITSMSADIW